MSEICPLIQGKKKCIEADCEWYDYDKDQCIIKTIADALDTIRDYVAEKQ